MHDVDHKQQKRDRKEIPWQERQGICQAIRRMLVEQFPDCFKGPGQPKPLLMIGISGEIMLRLPELTRRDLGFALFDYTGGSTYLRSFVPGAQRIDLDGSPVAEVTEAEIQNAQLRLRAQSAAAERRQDARRVTQAHETMHQLKEGANG
jgi:ProP effector